MASRSQMVWMHRLRMLALNSRVLRLNLRHGWTSAEQRYECFEAGQDAVKRAGHHPINPNQHPVLKEAFDDGALSARGHFELEQADELAEVESAMQKTYAAVQREEINDVFDECRELALVPHPAR